MLPFRFGVYAAVAPTMSAWRDQARKAEDLGYSTLYVSDHLDAQFGPLVATTVAAEATSTLHVGPFVLNNDLRNPVVLAKEIATLGLAAEGRVEVGLGAGSLRQRLRPNGDRVRRTGSPGGPTGREPRCHEEAVELTGRRPSQGRTTRCAAPTVILARRRHLASWSGVEASDCLRSQPERRTPSGSIRAWRWARSAGTTVQATLDRYDRCLTWIREAAPDRFDSIELQIVAFATRIVASRRAAARTATMLGLPGEDALELPIVLIGSVDELCERLLKRRERWGFTNIVVPAEAMESFAPVVAQLAGT